MGHYYYYHYYYYYYYHYYLKRWATLGWQRAIYAYQNKRDRRKSPQPHNTNLQTEKREFDNSRRERGSAKLWLLVRIGLDTAFKTRQSHTIENRVRKIVPQRHCDGNKKAAVMRGVAAKGRIGILMCDQSTACHPHWNLRQRYITIKRVHRVTPDLI